MKDVKTNLIYIKGNC